VKLTVYYRSLSDNEDPDSINDVRDEILWMEEENDGCCFSTNSTSMCCSKKFNKYWVTSKRRGTSLSKRVKYLKNNIISKNFYRRMRFDLDQEVED
jgi:hypothetical protein